MKRITLFVCSLLLLFTGCDESRGVVKFATVAREVRIYTSSKAMTINWGDRQTESYTSTDTTEIKHAYTDYRSHTIQINVEKLTFLDMSLNTDITWLDCSNNQLTALDLSWNTDLTWLDCSHNKLTALDVSGNTALRRLDCGFNKLTALDVSRNTALMELACHINKLTALDVSRNTSLKELGCWKNKLAVLDVSRNTALKELHCSYNRLTALDLSQNKSLMKVDCHDNRLTAKALNALFSGLPVVLSGTLWIEHNRGTRTCNRSIATKKRWTVY